jgi:hypothetical protein
MTGNGFSIIEIIASAFPGENAKRGFFPLHFEKTLPTGFYFLTPGWRKPNPRRIRCVGFDRKARRWKPRVSNIGFRQNGNALVFKKEFLQYFISSK